MVGVYNRKLFAKKATEARDKLRAMGGVGPVTPPNNMGGILASSPELMQAAAMRRPVVLPSSTTPPQQPVPAPQPQMLPPSQPIPNIAGIPQGPTPMAPAPRPMAQKPGVRKLNEGGEPLPAYMKGAAEVFSIASDLNPQLRTFKDAFKFGQRAVTSAKAEDLGLPQELTDQMETRRDEIVNNPVDAAQNNVAENVPENQRTGNLQKDLVKAAQNVGLENVPTEAKIDQLNKAIAGAQLGAALAGNYVNPNTGQELRPTAGARIGSAVAQGLAVARDTEQRRAKQEAALAAAKIKAAGKSTSGKGFLDSATGKSMLKMAENAIGKDLFDAAALEDFMLKSYGQEAYDAYRQALREQAAGVIGQNVPTTQEEPEEEPAVVTEEESTGFVPTLTLEDGTPIMLQGNKWVDAQGNDRTNG